MRAIKSLGQNFLTSPTLAEKIVALSNPSNQDTYLEIGPGKGALTSILASRVKRLICVEKDLLLSQTLKDQYSLQTNIEFVTEDIMRFNVCNYIEEQYKVIGSLPFNISKRIITMFLAQQFNRPTEMTFVIQKEVAEKYVATPPRATYLSNYVQLYANCERILNIKKGNFNPRPKVDASVIKLELIKPQNNHKKLAQFIRVLFKSPRKMIRNNIKSILPTNKRDSSYSQFSEIIDLAKRPSEISFGEICKLYMVYNKITCHEDKKETTN